MAKPGPILPPDIDPVAYFRSLRPDEWPAALDRLPRHICEPILAHWIGWTHPGQRPPETLPGGAAWRTWALVAGRGFGKTRAGAEWIALAARDPAQRIALVGATIEDARMVMVEGVSGLLAVASQHIAEWRPSIGRLRFTSGAEAMLYSGSAPEKLRGPEHSLAWCDELAKWPRPQATWDMLQLGLRLGPDPRALVTTTPRLCDTLAAILADPATVTTHGATWANPFLPQAFLNAMHRQYAGTRLADQELEGRMPTERPGQLFSRDLLARCRINPSGPLSAEPLHPVRPERSRRTVLPSSGTAQEGPGWHPINPDPQVHYPPSTDHLTRTPWPQGPAVRPERSRGTERFRRLAIGLDPPAAGGTCGIVVCALDHEGFGHVLEDCSIAGASPERWARAVAEAFARWHGQADQAVIVAEVNQGGDMVRSVLRHADPALAKAVRDVRARQSKAIRAEPVALLFEQGRVRLHGRFEALETELMRLDGDTGRGPSPDRADAMVWAITHLMLGQTPEPKVRAL